MLVAADAEDVGLLAMDARERADAVGREKFVFIEHVAQHALQPLARRDGQQAVLVPCGQALAVGDVLRQIRAVLEEPLHAAS